MADVEDKKKRGRKPKVVADDASDAKACKKRGRKPVTKMFELTGSDGGNFQDCIIAHLKLDPKDMSQVMNMMQGGKGSEGGESPGDTDAKQNSSVVDSIVLDDTVLDGDAVARQCATCKDMERQVKRLSEKVKFYEEELRKTKSRASNPFSSKNLHLVGCKFRTLDGDDKSELASESACWWCCHNFEGPAVGLPEHVHNTIFSVFGCFCSLNCAMAYNQDRRDTRMYERDSLIHQIKASVDPNGRHDLHPAPARQTLQMFGGPLTIDEYRDNFVTSTREYRLLMPPMAALPVVIEENSKDMPFGQKMKLSRLIEGPVIKRTKPIHQASNNIFNIVKA